jgi:hypothetical protein
MATGILVLIGTACSLRADSICISGGACDQNWQPFATPISHTTSPGPTGFAYFDGFSYDAPNANIAYFIEGQGTYLNDPASPGQRLPYWGETDGSAVPSFYFQSGGVAQIATLVLSNGLWAPSDSIGWYDPDNPLDWGWIFEANGTAPAVLESVEFTPSVSFGLFFVPDLNDPTYASSPSYYTDSSLNGIALGDVDYAADNSITLGPETPYQHFAVFDDLSGGYYVGVNDRSNQVGDLDYNDMVITLAPVPEPGYGPAVAVLLITFPLWYRRIRSKIPR